MIKKIIMLMAVMCFNIAIFAQEHIIFKGIPLSGDISSFTNKLKQKGCVVKNTKNNMVVLTGKFINKNCDIYVLGSKKSKTIWKVVVFLPKENSWTSLKDEYQSTKEQYQRKYGEGKSYEFFGKPYYEGDGYELLALKKEKCTYITFFETDLGSIAVEIGQGGYVKIGYEDKKNTEIEKKERQEIIDSDI